MAVEVEADSSQYIARYKMGAVVCRVHRATWNTAAAIQARGAMSEATSRTVSAGRSKAIAAPQHHTTPSIRLVMPLKFCPRHRFMCLSGIPTFIRRCKYLEWTVRCGITGRVDQSNTGKFIKIGHLYRTQYLLFSRQIEWITCWFKITLECLSDSLCEWPSTNLFCFKVGYHITLFIMLYLMLITVIASTIRSYDRWSKATTEWQP